MDYDMIDEQTRSLYRQGISAFGGISPTCLGYLLFMNILTILLPFQRIKKSPINTGFTGLNHILYYLRNSRLAHALREHGIDNFLKASDIRTCYIVAFHAIALSRVINIVVDIHHNIL